MVSGMRNFYFSKINKQIKSWPASAIPCIWGGGIQRRVKVEGRSADSSNCVFNLIAFPLIFLKERFPASPVNTCAKAKRPEGSCYGLDPECPQRPHVEGHQLGGGELVGNEKSGHGLRP